MNADASMLPWQVLLVDDEPTVHEVTRLVLRDLTFSGRPVIFHSAYSGEQGIAHLAAHPDTALMLLDVVMETDHAGLEVVQHVRQQLRNTDVQIVLRTGHPGMAPEAQVVTDYEINGYFVKTELTAQKLLSVVIAGLRSYQYLKTLQQQHAPQAGADIADDDDAAIARALEATRYRLLAQCQFALADGTPASVALLPEWPVADGWMPHAALSGRIRDAARISAVNAALLRDACALANAWHAERGHRAPGHDAAGRPLRISVPLLLAAAGNDAGTFQHLASLVRDALADAGLPGSALDIQLPGNLPSVFDSAEAAHDACAQLRELGVSITLNDIGNGPISLAHLRRLLPDRLQIAASDACEVADDAERAAIARAVIALGHTLGVQVLASGVTRAADLQFFKWEGCDLCQGDLTGARWDAENWRQMLPAG
ncbi:EAL domain-containing response regulator [Burkholderia anthina]|uniref:EAL domain-containing response regulator n=1 Tax=Burkholderia anthina TaxID=179879 RepID=UPI00158DC381|nr:EAL domain-containing response regulator [Burkholderia anthina]